MSLSRRVCRSVSRSTPSSHDALTAVVAPRGQFVLRRTHRLVAHAMSLFSRRRPSCGAPQNESVASTLARHGCPHLAFVAPRSRRSLASPVEFVVFTLSSGRLPGWPSRSCARPAARLPEREPVRSRCSPPSFLRVERLRVSVSRIHEAPRHAVPCASSGSRCDDRTAQLPVRFDVANGDPRIAWSPKRFDHRARDVVISGCPAMPASRVEPVPKVAPAPALISRLRPAARLPACRASSSRP
jgi:hypothetical protein